MTDLSTPGLPGRSSRLEQVLTALLSTAPELEAAAVVSFDGLPMASALPTGMDEDRVAAMSAALLSLGDRAAQGLGRGELSQVYVEGEHGTVFLVSADDEAVLVAVANSRAKVGLMLFEVRRAAQAVAAALVADDLDAGIDPYAPLANVPDAAVEAPAPADYVDAVISAAAAAVAVPAPPAAPAEPAATVTSLPSVGSIPAPPPGPAPTEPQPADFYPSAAPAQTAQAAPAAVPAPPAVTEVPTPTGGPVMVPTVAPDGLSWPQLPQLPQLPSTEAPTTSGWA